MEIGICVGLLSQIVVLRPVSIDEIANLTHKRCFPGRAKSDSPALLGYRRVTFSQVRGSIAQFYEGLVHSDRFLMFFGTVRGLMGPNIE